MFWLIFHEAMEPTKELKKFCSFILKNILMNKMIYSLLMQIPVFMLIFYFQEVILHNKTFLIFFL